MEIEQEKSFKDWLGFAQKWSFFIGAIGTLIWVLLVILSSSGEMDRQGLLNNASGFGKLNRVIYIIFLIVSGINGLVSLLEKKEKRPIEFGYGCPQCHCEYNKDVTTCADCNVPLEEFDEELIG